MTDPLACPPIEPANIDWQTDDSGHPTPFATQFSDVYYSRADGLAESAHVFLAGNALPQRFADLSTCDQFSIAELGFGTGLNFLATWQLWQQLVLDNSDNQSDSNTLPHLHFISYELYPLQRHDITKALQAFPDVADYAVQLIAQYPTLVTGCHRLVFGHASITLDLWFGDATFFLPQLAGNQTLYPAIDAWYLDGFNPKHNQQLWSEQVLSQIQRLSTVGTTAASFSVAGIIKRGLQAHGFEITKQKGYGRKREMLTAVMTANTLTCHTQTDNTTAAETQVTTALTPNCHATVGIIGAGIAGLATAHALARRGYQVTIIDKSAPLAGASGNPVALLAPKLTTIEQVNKHLHSIGCMYTLNWLEHVLTSYSPNGDGEITSNSAFIRSGVIDFMSKSKLTLQHVLSYPDDFVKLYNPANTASMTSSPPVLLPNAGFIDTHQLCRQILSHAAIDYMQATVTGIDKTDHAGVSLTTHRTPPTDATIQDDLTQPLRFDYVVICCAWQSHALDARLEPLNRNKGQLSWLPIDPAKHPLPQPIKYGGYACQHRWQNQHYLFVGATFDREDMTLAVTAAAHQSNLTKLQAALSDTKMDADDFSELTVTSAWHGRVGYRAQPPDYMPIVGMLDDHVGVMTGFGAKGYATAPWCAEVIASQINQEIPPASQFLLNRLNPYRFD